MHQPGTGHVRLLKLDHLTGTAYQNNSPPVPFPPTLGFKPCTCPPRAYLPKRPLVEPFGVAPTRTRCNLADALKSPACSLERGCGGCVAWPLIGARFLVAQCCSATEAPSTCCTRPSSRTPGKARPKCAGSSPQTADAPGHRPLLCSRYR